ncbi:CcdB family protein [Sphingopyxis panaciterrae]
MPQFDVCRTADGGLVLDCQSDLLHHLNTRLVVPLLTADQFEVVARRLNPLFIVDGVEHVMYTQFASAIPANQIFETVVSLEGRRFEIMNALDVLLAGV